MRKELKIGMVAGGVSILLNRFTSTPDFLLGMLTGISICFTIVGLLSNNKYKKLKSAKS